MLNMRKSERTEWRGNGGFAKEYSFPEVWWPDADVGQGYGTVKDVSVLAKGLKCEVLVVETLHYHEICNRY
jgi:hypothetical protein